jgi:hypothetical protein
MGVELWAKPYMIKLRCYWKHTGERIWEHSENLMGTHCEQGEKQKIPLSSPLPPLKKKKTGLFMSAC